MLWKESKAAAQKMGESSLIGCSGSSGDSTIDCSVDESKGRLSNDDIVQGDADPVTTGRKKVSSSLHYTLARLHKRASVQKSKRDIDGAIESTKIILELRRAALSNNQQEGKRDCSKEKKHVADALVSLAHVVLIKEETNHAESYFKEAAELYRSSGMKKEDDRLQQISRELDRLSWQQKCNQNKK